MLDNILDIIKSLSNIKEKKEIEQPIPKEIKDQYPYGEFPIKYTKSGQETIRKQSENRFSYSEESKIETNKKSDLDSLGLLLPLIQAFSGDKKQPKDLMQIFGKLLFKDNPELLKLFSALPKTKSKEIVSVKDFPDTNKVNISSLKRID